MQVDRSNPNNAKHITKLLVKSICGIKTSRNQKVSTHLQNDLQVLASNLEQPSDDFRVKEAILHSLGNLKEHIERSMDLQVSIEPLLQ